MRYVLTGGGTGGHVYPALAVAEALTAIAADKSELLYVGSSDGMEAGLVAEAGLPFRGISAGAIRGRSPLGLALGAARLTRGLFEAFRLLDEAPTAAVLATGGYVCVPVVLAAWLRRVPSLLYLPDVRPGLAVRFLSRFATRIAVTSADSRAFFPAGAAAKVIATGYPVRPDVAQAEREPSRSSLGVPIDARVLLVFGGSRGARTLNEATFAGVGEIAAIGPNVHVLHVCGGEDEARARARRAELPAEIAERYHPFAYLHSAEMAAALASADLVVSRSGASTMGEFPAVGLPSVQVPYPYAGAHQRHNAEYLVRAGAAVLLDNEAVRQGALPGMLRDLLTDRERLAAMAAAARRLARPDAARRIADLLVALRRGDARLSAGESEREG